MSLWYTVAENIYIYIYIYGRIVAIFMNINIIIVYITFDVQGNGESVGSVNVLDV